MSERPSSGGGCFTEALAFLAFLWLLTHWDETLAFLDRLIAS